MLHLLRSFPCSLHIAHNSLYIAHYSSNNALAVCNFAILHCTLHMHAELAHSFQLCCHFSTLSRHLAPRHSPDCTPRPSIACILVSTKFSNSWNFNSVRDFDTFFITSHSFRFALHRWSAGAPVYILMWKGKQLLKLNGADMQRILLALELFCSLSRGIKFFAVWAGGSNRDKTHFLPLPPYPPTLPFLCSTASQYFPVPACCRVGSLLCRKSFTNSASCLPPPPPSFTSLDISQHTHVLHQGRETSPENDFPPGCPSPASAPATLVLVLTLYEVARRCHYIQHQ